MKWGDPHDSRRKVIWMLKLIVERLHYLSGSMETPKSDQGD
jgi:hypothetical protein